MSEAVTTAAPAAAATPSPAAATVAPVTPAAAPAAPSVDASKTSAAEVPAATKTLLTGKALDEGKAPEGTTQTGQEAKPTEAAPTLELKLPEGVAVDAGLLEGFKAIALESKLPGDVAQKVVDFYAKTQAESQSKLQEQVTARIEQTQRQWMEELKSDKEFGGSNLPATLKAASAAFERFAAPVPGLVEFLEKTQLGNHPGLLRAFASIGRAMAEDKVAGPTTPTAGPLTEDQKHALLFPNTKF